MCVIYFVVMETAADGKRSGDGVRQEYGQWMHTHGAPKPTVEASLGSASGTLPAADC